jgi:non-ribosomal peptide synthase protein (TIGR01720 family)
MLRLAEKESGLRRGSVNRSRYRIEIVVMIVRDRLVAEWTYDETFHRRETVRKLARDYRRALVAYATPDGSTRMESYDVIDFPLARLTQKELDALHSSLARRSTR